MKLKNRTILVTGGTSGIGLAFAKKFLEMGNMVLVTSRSKQKIDQVIKENPNLIGIAADVSQVKSVEQLAQQIKQQYPKLDVLFNSAGIMRYYDLFAEEVTGEQLTEEINTNLNGTIYVTKALLPLLAKQEEAMIVNVSSLLANISVASSPIYSATKAGIHMYTDALREQIRAKNEMIHVIELCPPLISETNLEDKMSRHKSMKLVDLPLAKLVDAGIKGMEKNKIRLNPGFSKIMRFISKITPDLATHQLGKATMSRMYNEKDNK